MGVLYVYSQKKFKSTWGTYIYIGTWFVYMYFISISWKIPQRKKKRWINLIHHPISEIFILYRDPQYRVYVFSLFFFNLYFLFILYTIYRHGIEERRAIAKIRNVNFLTHFPLYTKLRTEIILARNGQKWKYSKYASKYYSFWFRF